MKGNAGRSRPAPAQCERDPFGLGLRPKSSPSIVEVAKRRARNNGENMAPDGGATNILDTSSTTPSKPVTKGSKTSGGGTKEAPVPGSPALMPKLPRPSPARSIHPLCQGQDAITQVPPTGPGPDQAHCSKRKLNLEVQVGGVVEGIINAAAVDPSDTGVKVIVRMRPLNKKEEAEEATHVVQKVSSNSVSLGDQQFTYDAVAGETESQKAVFEMVGLPMVENCLAGFNSSIFAYGQTGSGKTHTMWGPMSSSSTEPMPTEERGITPRVFEQLFARIQQEERNNVDKQLRYQCRCSFLEIYNEQITDLLEPTQKNLMIREDTKTGVYVEGLTEEYVSNMDDVTCLLVRGLANRRVGSTSMNNESSRSHSVFTFVIESRSKSIAEGASSVRTSRMNLVDLAGSERQKQTGAAGERLKEAGNINKSLSQLGNVINILAEVAQNGKQRHIPYRDSRLTFLLQESLGGNAKLAMICAISPASSCRTETLSTLRFAQRAKAMQNKAVVNEETANDVNLLREQIRQLKDELTRMKENSGNQHQGPAGGFSNGWNARRSYNLLRLSLGQPMTISPVDFKDMDKEVELIRQDVHEFETIDEDVSASLIDTETKELLPQDGIKDSETRPAIGEDGEELGELHKQQDSTTPSGPDFPELTLSLISPPLSESPKVKEEKNSALGLPKSPLGGNVRSSKAFASSTEQLAASLTRGIEVLDNHQRYSLSIVRRFSDARFSFQNADSPSTTKLKTLISSSNTPLEQETQDALCLPENENVSTEALTAQPESTAPGELCLWPQKSTEDSSKMIVPTTPPAQKQHSQDMEVLLAGSLRREKTAEETITQQAADIEQLSRLVRQYKLERECNAILQQSREEKIARMESLVDGILSVEDFCTDEWIALQLEHKFLQKKFEQHPELADAKAEQQLLRHEIQQYKSFCDLGEREKLQEEIVHLRNQLHTYLEMGTPGSLKHRRLSLTPKKSVLPHSPIKLMSLTAVPEAMPSCESTSSSNHVKEDVPPVSLTEARASELLEQERREWDEREREWTSVVQELREECDHHMQLAEKRQKELEIEKRCSQEIHDALQMAMTGHARLLDNYAELQEKHIIQLGKMREIREGVLDIKKVAKRSGLNNVEERWFDVQATQIVYMKVEQDRYREEIQGLQAQLQDTADAVQAAGELLVRLKEAEQAAIIAKQSAEAAEQEASEVRKDLEKSHRRHAKEVASLKQQLLNSPSQTAAPCPKCGASDHVKSHEGQDTKGDDDDQIQNEVVDNGDASKTGNVTDSWSSSTSLSDCTEDKCLSDCWASGTVVTLQDDKKSVLDSWTSGRDEVEEEDTDEVEEEEDEEFGRESLRFSRKGYQNLENLEIEFEDEDDYLCEVCGQTSTNGMRVCDSCI